MAQGYSKLNQQVSGINQSSRRSSAPPRRAATTCKP